MNSIQFYRTNLSKDLPTAESFFLKDLNLEECLFAFYHIVMDSHVKNRDALLEIFLKKIEDFELLKIMEKEEDRRSWVLFTETTVKMLEGGFLTRRQYDNIWKRILKLELLKDGQELMDEMSLEYNSVLHIELFEELLEEHRTADKFIEHWLEHDKIIDILNGSINTKINKPEIVQGYFVFFVKFAEKYSDSKGNFNAGQSSRYKLCLKLIEVAKLNKYIESDVKTKLKSHYSILD